MLFQLNRSVLAQFKTVISAVISLLFVRNNSSSFVKRLKDNANLSQRTIWRVLHRSKNVENSLKRTLNLHQSALAVRKLNNHCVILKETHHCSWPVVPISAFYAYTVHDMWWHDCPRFYSCNWYLHNVCHCITSLRLSFYNLIWTSEYVNSDALTQLIEH